MDFGVFFGALIISYGLCAFVVVSTVSDLLPKDTFETRWKRLALWAVALAAVITSIAGS